MNQETLTVPSLQSIAPTREQILARLKIINDRGIDLASEAEGIDTRRDGRAFLEHTALLASALESVPSEHEKIDGRGRPETRAEEKARAVELWQTGEFSIDEIQEATGLSRATVYRAIKAADT